LGLLSLTCSCAQLNNNYLPPVGAKNAGGQSGKEGKSFLIVIPDSK